MAPNFKELNKNQRYCSNCDCGCPAILIARISEISECVEHNCEANRFMIQIPAQIFHLNRLLIHLSLKGCFN
ncbi:hypothetical protein HZS_3640 [Henneguya salminicola]|nr:hypothetical protein HZS_3640 [Henneguya salminicola]